MGFGEVIVIYVLLMLLVFEELRYHRVKSEAKNAQHEAWMWATGKYVRDDEALPAGKEKKEPDAV